MSRSSAITIGVILTAVVGGYSLGYLRTGNPTPASTVESSLTGLSPSEIDLGEHLWGKEIAFELTFFNRETEPVVVSSVKSSCGCTILSDKDAFAQRQVAPGGSLIIPGKLTTPKDPGQRTSVVTLTLTSGVTHTSNVKVNVKGTWRLTPKSLDFGEIPADGSIGIRHARVISFVSETDSVVGAPVADVPWIKCDLGRGGRAATDILVEVLPERLPPGKSLGSVTVRTSSSAKPTGVFYVRASLVQELAATPPIVILRGDRPQKARFTDRDGQSVRLASAHSQRDAIRVEVLEDGYVRIWNPAAIALPESVKVRVVDDQGRRGALLVSSF